MEEKAEAPGEAPDPAAAGLSGARPLGLGVAVLPPLPPDNVPFQPSALAKKRPPTLPTVPPPPPPRLDQEVTSVARIIHHLNSLTLSACACKPCSPTAIIIMILDNFTKKMLSLIIQLISVICLTCHPTNPTLACDYFYLTFIQKKIAFIPDYIFYFCIFIYMY